MKSSHPVDNDSKVRHVNRLHLRSFLVDPHVRAHKMIFADLNRWLTQLLINGPVLSIIINRPNLTVSLISELYTADLRMWLYTSGPRCAACGRTVA